MGDPSSEKGKGKVTKILIWGLCVIFGMILGQITFGLFTPLWMPVLNYIWPPKLELTLTECIMYRTDYHHFPTCEMNITVWNPTIRNVTAELKEITFFRDDITCRFATGQKVISVEAKGPSTEDIEFRDKVLDLALKIPQDSSTAMIKMIWEYTETNSKDSLILTDSNVIKCSYWQSPVFTSDTEAIAVRALGLGFTDTVSYTDTLTGEEGKVSRVSGMLFTDKSGLKDFNIDQFMSEFSEGKLGWDVYRFAFRRRYGGTYLGVLTSDTANCQPSYFPHNLFGDMSDYEVDILLGMTLEQDFSEIKEFIYYNFDPAKEKEKKLFRICQENSDFYILLVFEDDHEIPAIMDSLAMLCYRPDSKPTKGLSELWETILRITPDNKIDSLIKQLNTGIDSLNLIIRRDGVFIFFPIVLKLEMMNRIIEDIGRLTGKSDFMALTFDCRPFKARLRTAPFSIIPIFVFLNFSEETKSAKIDSLDVGWH